MGGCFSSNTNNNHENTAKVISISGDLREYAAPVGVGHVLAAEMTSFSDKDSSYFVCNSDSLYFDELIPVLDSEYQLRPNQIYFVLAASMREQPLSASDMVALAVKASQALQHSNNNNNNNKSKKKKHSRISPLILFHNNGADIPDGVKSGESAEYQHPRDYHYELTIGAGASTGVRTKKKTNSNSNNTRSSLQRLTSRRAKMAVRSFRLRLSTIYESSIL